MAGEKYSKCSVDECISPRSAKGFCRKHYNANRRRNIVAICSLGGCCGKVVFSRNLCEPHYLQVIRVKPCTVSGCGGNVRSRGLCKKHYFRAYASGKQFAVPRLQPGGPKRATPRLPRLCSVCGNLRGSGRRYCSAKCMRMAAPYRSRQAGKEAKKRSLDRAGIRFDPFAVFERDGWRCQICGRRTPKAQRGKNKSSSPELDHVVPLSKGGLHSMANTQCACRDCNGWKSDRVVVGQLSLFASASQ
jgi:5-methylcytosine-specific restriction endonuclease McrA